MASLWQWRLIMIAPLAAATEANRNALSDIVAASSGESQANERKMFDNAIRVALAASPGVQAGWGLSFPVKQSMRDDLQALISTINQGQTAPNRIHWYLLNNDENENILISSSRNSAYVTARIGQVFRLSDVATDLGIVEMTS